MMDDKDEAEKPDHEDKGIARMDIIVNNEDIRQEEVSKLDGS